MVLSYLGEAPTTGIPNVGRAPVKPGEEQLLLTPEVKDSWTNEKPQNYVKEAAEELCGGVGDTYKTEDVLEITSSTHSDTEDEVEEVIKDPTEADFEAPAYPNEDAEPAVEVLCTYTHYKILLLKIRNFAGLGTIILPLGFIINNFRLYWQTMKYAITVSYTFLNCFSL